jgi:hypothetical protein
MGGFYAQIPLMGQHPEVQSMPQALQAFAQVGNTRADTQVRQQQAQQMALQNQQMQLQLQDQQGMAQAWRNVIARNTAQVSDGSQGAQNAPQAGGPPQPGQPSAMPMPAQAPPGAQQGGAPVPLSGIAIPGLAPPTVSVPPMNGAAVPMSQGAASPAAMQGNAQAPATPQATPAPRAALQPTGSSVMDQWIAEMQKLDVRPSAIMGAQNATLEYLTKKAALTKEDLANEAQQNDKAAGMWASFAQQPLAYKQANWQAFSDDQVRRQNLTLQQAQALGNPYANGDEAAGNQAVNTAAHMFLSESQLSTQAERMGTAARGQAYAAEAIGKQNQAENQQAAATFPSDPRDLPGYLADPNLPSRIKTMLAGKPYAQAQAIVQRNALPPADYAKMQQQDTANAWDQAVKASQAGQSQWNEVNAKLAITNPDVAAMLRGIQYDPNTTTAKVREMALNPEQGQQAANQNANRDLRDVRLDQLAEQLQNQEARWAASQGGGGQTPNSAAVDRRTRAKQYQDVQDTEADLNSTRNTLGAAITGGTTYIDRKGNPVAIADATTKTGMNPDQLKADMLARHDQATAQLERAVTLKNNLITQNGGTPGVPTEQAVTDIRAGNAKLHDWVATKGQPPASPTPAPNPQTPAAQPRASAPTQAASPTPQTTGSAPELGVRRPGQHGKPPGQNQGQGRMQPQAPPADVVSRVSEGQLFYGPDGTAWKKVNGKAVQQR